MAKILVYAFDLEEAAQIRRIRALIADGHQVTTASMRRNNMNAGFSPDWGDVPLFVTENERFLRRIAVVARSIVRMWRYRAVIAGSDLVIARNFDMAMIAWLGGLAARGRRPLVYECLDVHGLFTRKGSVGAVMRWVERRLLARTDLLLTSSEGFVRHYFAPVQGFRGTISLIENKLWFDRVPPERPSCATRKHRASIENKGDGRAPDRAPSHAPSHAPSYAPGRAPSEMPDAGSDRRRSRPLVLGWVGSIRCAPSLDLLLDAAVRLGPDLMIEIHGNLHAHAVPEFHSRIAARGNIRYHGPYRYPDDLARIYGSLDLVWAQDLWQRGENSDWLLPNRIYEASYFGCPSLAVEGTETGRRVREDRLGLTIARPDIDALMACLGNLAEDTVEHLRARLLDRDASAFRLEPGDLTRALAPVLDPKAHGGAHDGAHGGTHDGAQHGTQHEGPTRSASAS